MLATHCLGSESCSCNVKARQQDKGVFRYSNSSMPSVFAASTFLEVRPRPRLLAGPWRQRRVQTASETRSTILSTPIIV